MRDDPNFMEYIRAQQKHELKRAFGDHLVRNNVRMRTYRSSVRPDEEVIESEVFVFSHEELEAFLHSITSHVHYVGDIHGNDMGVSDIERFHRGSPWGEEDGPFGVRTRKA